MSSKNKKRNDVTTEIVVGAFMFIITVILLTISVVISQNKFFEESYSLTATFPQIGGLKEGEAIFFRGVKIGYVEKIEITLGAAGVNVTMHLLKEFDLYNEYEIYVEPASLLGGMRLVIYEGSPELGALSQEEMNNLMGSAPRDVISEAGKLIESIRESMEDEGTLTNISKMTKNLSEITDKINAGEGTIGRLIQDDGLYDKALSMVENLSAASKNIQTISERLAAGEGTIGKLLSEDESAYNSLTNILDQISLASEDVRVIMNRVEQGEGTIGKLLSEDDELYNDLREAVASLKVVSSNLADESGTVGKLINDDTLYIKVESLIDEARATIDDFRETSPITTFSSIFFGAF